MKKILILQNVIHERLGLLEELLIKNNIESDVFELDNTLDIPSLDNYNALIVMGGWDSANDKSKKIKKELEIITEALNKKIPYLGICLGLQLLVKAAGGYVRKNEIKELGFRDPDNNLFEVILTPEGKEDLMFEGLGNRFNVFQLHGETVELSGNNMFLLGEGRYCKNQIVRVGNNAYGIQCHFELTQTMFEEWLITDPDLVKMDHKQLKNDFLQIKTEYTKTGNILFSNFLNNVL